MKKTLTIIIAIVLLLGVGFVYLVKNPELPIAQKVLSVVGMDKPTNTNNRAIRNQQNGARVGMANPASRNCERKGGTIEIVDGTGGQVGMCTLVDGTVCEERAYMRGECGLGRRGLPSAINSGATPGNPEGTACTMEYTPVCASVQVQCIKAPCPPIEQTFGNRCMMDAAKTAKFLYEGTCKAK